jgi:hypothetical protein
LIFVIVITACVRLFIAVEHAGQVFLSQPILLKQFSPKVNNFSFRGTEGTINVVANTRFYHGCAVADNAAIPLDGHSMCKLNRKTRKRFSTNVAIQIWQHKKPIFGQSGDVFRPNGITHRSIIYVVV